MTETEFVDIVAISQMTPGPIGINCATYVGYTATGSIWGSLLASIAIIIPSLLIMLTICRIYDHIRDKWKDNHTFKTIMRVIRLLVVILIAHAAISLMTPASFIDRNSWIIFILTLLAMLSPMAYKDITKWQGQETRPVIKKVTEIISHPILLIILAGAVGYLLY